MYKDLSVQDKKCFRKKMIKGTLKQIGFILSVIIAALVGFSLIVFAIKSVWGIVLIGVLFFLGVCINSGYEAARKEQQDRENAREQIASAKGRIVKYTDFINEALLNEENSEEEIEREVNHWKKRIQEEEEYIAGREERLKKLGG